MKHNYKQIAKEARLTVLDMIYQAQSSHVGSNFSCLDILAVLKEHIDLTKDRLIFSKGWVAASAFWFLAEKGVIPRKDLKRFCKKGEQKYIGLVEPTVKGIDFAGGSVGYGISAGVGFALGKKLQGKKGIVYVLESDGAMDVGMNWEAARIAADNKLDNLCVIVDCNGFQAMKAKNDLLLTKKWASFGWSVTALPGHEHETIKLALDSVVILNDGRPKVLLAQTVKGKGVKEFEGNNLWHYKNIPHDVYQRAVEEINES